MELLPKVLTGHITNYLLKPTVTNLDDEVSFLNFIIFDNEKQVNDADHKRKIQ